MTSTNMLKIFKNYLSIFVNSRNKEDNGVIFFPWTGSVNENGIEHALL